METTTQEPKMSLSVEQRQNILRSEIRKALASLKPQLVGVGDLARPQLTGSQIAAAKGIGSKRALAIIDQHDAVGRLNGRDFARAMKREDAAR
jgi:hypothetical protein